MEVCPAVSQYDHEARPTTLRNATIGYWDSRETRKFREGRNVGPVSMQTESGLGALTPRNTCKDESSVPRNRATGLEPRHRHFERLQRGLSRLPPRLQPLVPGCLAPRSFTLDAPNLLAQLHLRGLPLVREPLALVPTVLSYFRSWFRTITFEKLPIPGSTIPEADRPPKCHCAPHRRCLGSCKNRDLYYWSLYRWIRRQL